MNQLQAIRALHAKTKVCKINDTEITIHVLALDDMSLFEMSKDASLNEQTEKTIKLIAKCLDTPEEEVAKISIEWMESLMEAIMEAHGMTEEKEKTSKVKNFIIQKQEQMAAQNAAKK
jgi:hypothetical protein